MAATNSLQSLHHPRHNPTFLKPSTTHTPATTWYSTNSYTSYSVAKTRSFSAVFAASASSTSLAAEAALAAASSTSLDLLAIHLTAQNFRQADEETRRLLIALAGEAAIKRGYVFFSEVKFIPSSDLKAIDDLWLAHSNGKFGYSVQKSIWDKSDQDFSRFFVRVGWMRKLDTEVTQYIYRAFPDEFTWELTPDTPTGHLPLTNALRGTQLLKCVLSHPAFADVEGGVDDDVAKRALLGTNPLSKNRAFKSDYSF